MSITITDPTVDPLLVTESQSLAAFKDITVADSSPLSNTETVSITLSQSLNPPLGPNYDFYPTVTNLGSISDPLDPNPSSPNGWDATTETFTESGVVGGDPTFATDLLSRLQYNAPELPNGQGFATQASITVTDGGVTTTDTIPIKIGVVSPPAITGTVPDEPVASGNSIAPFAIVNVTNPYFDYDYYTIVAGNPYNTVVATPGETDYNYNPSDTATIAVTVGGQATDADGLLTGPGLSKTGVGTYSLIAQQYYNIGYALQNLKFATNTLPPGAVENPIIQVDITDPTSGLITTNSNTSLLIYGLPPQPVPPTIEFTRAGQTVAPGNVLDPFASVAISDTNANPTDSATITLTNALGAATDANGTLTGSGLTETAAGSGVYTLAATSPSALTTELDSLTFDPTGLPSGVASETTTFTLAVSDPVFPTPATATISVTETAPSLSGPPVIQGTVAGQSVTQGTTVPPFAGVTIIDNAPNATDTAFIDLGSTTFGTLSLPNDPSALTASLDGERYTLSATDPADLTKEINALVFTPTSQTLAEPATATFALSVTDINNSESATDKTTTVTEIPMVGGPPPPPAPPTWLPPLGPPDYFSVADKSTTGSYAGGSWQSQGTPYSGPVAGLTSEFIAVTSDNINVTAETPNSFISLDGGSGEDAIAVNQVNGNNVLNGSTGSSFLYGGTGDDTFFVDDRNPPAGSDIWSTVVGFHSGDAATIWGVTPSDFNLAWVDGQGAAGYTGLTLHATAPGVPTASLTLAGLTSADLTNGTLSVSFGTTAPTGGVPGSTYMYVHAV